MWSKVAEDDLTTIVKYIAIDNLQMALKIFKKIKQRASNLYTFPYRGRIVPELKDQGVLQYRELIISPWRVIYRISKTHVYVLSVLDSRQNIEDIILKRLVNSKI